MTRDDRAVINRAAACIQVHEGCRLTAYQDGGGVWTIGWGHTRGVGKGDTCSQAEADAWLTKDMDDAVKGVASLPVPLTGSMRAALISLVYNIGWTRFSMSDTHMAVVGRKYLDVPKHMIGWRLIDGEPSLGLLRRRLAEATLFLADGLP
jgi:lysozyme